MIHTFIEWETLKLKKARGIEKIKCPNCINGRSNKKDRSLYVRHDSGVAKCYYCDALSFRDSVEQKTTQDYKLPVQTWRNYTELSDNVVKYFEGRKINQSTLKHFGVTEEMYYQPQKQKNVNNIVFNYFEANVLVNKKYRSADKKFTQSAGTKNMFYNINSIIGEKECYIVEGEIDCFSLHEIGIKNVVSLPNGANDTDDVWINCENYFKDIELFYIATDNDIKGNEVAEKIAQRLGRWRCQRVVFTKKDANEDLIEGVLNDSIKNISKYPVSGTYTVSDLYDKIIDLYDHGLPKTYYPKNNCFGNLKNIFSVMRGHLITGTGIPSSGKSTFTEWYVMNLVKDYNMKASFFSPEHSPLELHETMFIQKALGKSFWNEYEGIPRITKSEVNKYREWADEKIYLTSTENGEFPTWNWLFDKFKEQMFNFGVDIFVIDAFNKLQFDKKGQKLDMISTVLTKLTLFAQMNNVMIFLIAHPKKMSKKEDGTYNVPNLYDVSGSADFRNQTHDGFTIHRTYPNELAGSRGETIFINTKVKMSFQGQINEEEKFIYDIPSGRYYSSMMARPTFDMTQNYEQEQKQITYEPQEAFGIEDTDEIAF